ncbi:acyl-CoA dehydrogenase family protein [Bradyrhizobium brasilense]|uniref:acyl-CoA dehydrogenase family protein n=1 Tax=Bradyrhizobium brasilense TaxID=1419277 RepID=UPI0024B0EE12|nr:acyl-CoA dehydrogenase family protein [Bradyrhizobium australafricanum]WFU36278.1 acyl-CoA dehydrogenase family protein [Bradyrhizobium australafricanum]
MQMSARDLRSSADVADPARHISHDCAGLNFYDLDRGLRSLLGLYLSREDRERLEPHFRRLGELAGGRLDRLARIADKHAPVLNPRDAYGRDEDWIDYHPAYREMEAIAFGDFQFHAMSHRAGVLGMDRPLPAVAKYVFQYLFVQSEFGLMCPISVTDTSTHLVRKFGSEELKAYLLPKMLSDDMATLWKGTQFMTERAGGSDVGAVETVARRDGDVWRLTGDKWFCSHADADVALMLARPEGAPAGTKGLALFALPRRLKDGRRNSYRIVRLKDKLGTKSMASGEIRLDNAVAYLVGDPAQGLKQMMEQVNLSRLSHGVRAAAMMRRCVNEAMVSASSRVAFGQRVIDFPLLRRQLMKLIVPTEQALSMVLLAARAMDDANAGSAQARDLLRILTPLLKYRACRDNIPVATGAMEVRGGNGYIEEWVQPRLVRDAHVGVLWEGTSNINALDIISRAVGKSGAHRALVSVLHARIEEAKALPEPFRKRLRTALDRAIAFAERVAADPGSEHTARLAASALYHAASAIVLAWEGCQPEVDPRRLLLSRFVLEHRLSTKDPLAPADDAWERDAIGLMLSDASVTLDQAVRSLTA